MMQGPAVDTHTGLSSISMYDMEDEMHPQEALTRMLLPNPPLHFSDTSALPLQNTFEL